MHQEPSGPPEYFAVTLHSSSPAATTGPFVEDGKSLIAVLGITAPPPGPVVTCDSDGATPLHSVVPLELTWRTMSPAEADTAAEALAGTHWVRGGPGLSSSCRSPVSGPVLGDLLRFSAARGIRVAVTPYVVGFASGIGHGASLFLPRYAPAAWARAEQAPLVADPATVSAVLTRVGFLPDEESSPGHFTVSDGARHGRPGTVRLTATGESWFSDGAAMADVLHRDDFTAEETPYADVFTVRVATRAETMVRRESAARSSLVLSVPDAVTPRSLPYVGVNGQGDAGLPDLTGLNPGELRELAAPWPVEWLFPPEADEPERVISCEPRIHEPLPRP
ncbi:hypothetical protein [Streptomyces yaizuensis]|uniref:Uncharacterized protein n=1 Tax=Streptomyces yaizuensis TaxID=2989713 RepID=A0ABQ5P709_9ACTN|nr:hypothetical protein [Streptomyces sp. YSPA8]GLF98273.1 hypothetical protein SYYSPA8_28270 [Streptomyces sp. YSPA8]